MRMSMLHAPQAGAPWRERAATASAMALSLLFLIQPVAAEQSSDLDVALNLATALRAARTVVSTEQAHINDPDVGDKGLSGAVVVEKVLTLLRESAPEAAHAYGQQTREARLLQALLAAISEVMDEHQGVINQPGTAFKGFVPAVFARLVNERFGEKAGSEALMKVTAPTSLVRNRKARPDAWENDVIESRFQAPDWQRGQLFSEVTDVEGRSAFRVLVPEYYGEACLACHGQPEGAVDITGYPREGGTVGDLGGAISILLFRE